MMRSPDLLELLKLFSDLPPDDQAFVRARLDQSARERLDALGTPVRGFSPGLQDLVDRIGSGEEIEGVPQRSQQALSEALRKMRPARADQIPAVRTAFDWRSAIARLRGVP